MRAAIIFGILALVLGGIFYFFVMQTPPLDAIDIAPPATTTKVVPTTIPQLDGPGVIGHSEGVRVESIDAKTRRVINDFRCEDVIPRPDGSVDVVHPEVRFFGKTGAMVSLDGKDGHVFYTQAGDRNDVKALGTSTPTKGDLKDVTIRFFEKKDDAEPVITVVVPAIQFDSNSNRISTVDCVVNGQGYAAELVPVTMRGRDFDFDGQGLTVAWNDREGMLDQLEIIHGNRLLVHDVTRFIGTEVVDARPSPRQSNGTFTSAAMGLMMVTEAPVNKDASKDDHLYHATFDRDVHVTKNGVEVAAGESLRCVIPLGTSSAKPTGDADNAPKKKGKPSPGSRPARDSSESPATTQPQPLEIRWTGKLLIRPAKVVPDVPHSQMVELIGSPARVAENGTFATGRLIHVEPEAGRFRIEPGGSVRAIEIKDAAGTEIRSRSVLNVDQTQGVATIDGGGTLSVPADADKRSPLQLSWSRKLSLQLSKASSAHLERINVDGDAKVDSEKLTLECAALELAFDAPSTPVTSAKADSRFSMPSPELSLLRRVHASGQAICRVGPIESQRLLASQDIQLGFEAGDHDALLNSILCDGDVSLVDAKGMNLNAGNLSVQTKAISLSKSDAALGGDFLDLVTGFSAQKSVRIKRPDGSSVEGDDVELTGTGPQKHLIVTGTPATVASAKGMLRGNLINLDPETGDVKVDGAGKFAGTNPDRPGTDIAISWTQSMNVDGKTGACDFVGNVNIAGRDQKGSQLTADAKHGTMQFGVASATKPSSSAGLGAIQFDSIKTLTLDGGVSLSVQTADQRSSAMETDRLAIDLLNSTIDAPQPGRMLMIDQRANPPTGKKQFGPGAMAMQWHDRLHWDMRGGNLELLGGVKVGFEREGSNDPVRIVCNQLNGTLSPLDTASGFDQMTPRVDLKSLRALGDVMVRSTKASFDAAELNYDLLTQLASAHGTDTKPVEVFDAQGTSRIGFSTITWNLETGLIDDFRDITGQIRR